MVMLVEEMPPFMFAKPIGYDHTATFYLTINKTKSNEWSTGYQDYDTLVVLLAINNCENLEEVATRLNARLMRYYRMHAPKPRTLHNVPKSDTVGNTNITEGVHMPDESSDQKQLTYGQKLVGISFNPSGDARVNALKQSAADMIDKVREVNIAESTKEGTDESFLSDYAVQAILTAQMAAVKRATWNLGKTASVTNNGMPETKGTDTSDPLNQNQSGKAPTSDQGQDKPA